MNPPEWHYRLSDARSRRSIYIQPPLLLSIMNATQPVMPPTEQLEASLQDSAHVFETACCTHQHPPFICPGPGGRSPAIIS